MTGRQAQMIATALAERGHDVTAVVSQPSYDARVRHAPARERCDGTEVRRVSTGPFRGRRTRAVRLVGYVLYLAGALRASFRRSPDVVVTFHNPPFLPGLAMLIARRCGARVVYVPQDIHPDILLETDWLSLPRPLVRLWDAFNRAVLSRSDAVVALGEGMRQTLIAKGADAQRTIVIPSWAEPAFPALPRDDPWRDAHSVSRESLVVLYAGNMGLMHPLGEILDAADAVRDQDVRIIIAGEGVRRDHWVREVASRGLGHVLMLPYQREDDFRRLLAAADVAVVALSPGMERLAVPSRPYAYLAAGRPVIALTGVDADIAREVQAHGAGWHVDGADALIALLHRLRADPGAVRDAGVHARDLYERSFTREVAVARYVALVDELLAA